MSDGREYIIARITRRRALGLLAASSPLDFSFSLNRYLARWLWWLRATLFSRVVISVKQWDFVREVYRSGVEFETTD